MLGSITNALDFNDVRSQSDAELLYDAKYGKRGEDGRMSRYAIFVCLYFCVCTCGARMLVRETKVLSWFVYCGHHPLTREQYQALRRKIGGTGKDFFKEWVDVKGQFVEKGYVSTEETTVPGLPFLILTALALVACTAYVVIATS